MWIKWIATLVAFGALVQSAVACPSQCSCSGTTVNCDSRSLASVPGGIPTDKQRLWLNNNQITKLEPGVFDSLVNLQWFSLSSNWLRAFAGARSQTQEPHSHLAVRQPLGLRVFGHPLSEELDCPARKHREFMEQWGS
nr:truncated variable lymphocyte receptor [Petromyzon marinus]